MKQIVLFLFLLLFVNCTFNQINYPYAENNMTVYRVQDTIIEDEYKWLESNHNGYMVKKQWIDEQLNLSNKILGNRVPLFYERIESLGQIPFILNVGIYDDEIYYLRINLYTKEAKLYKYSRLSEIRTYIRDFHFPFLLKSNTKASLSPDKNQLAIISENPGNSYSLHIYKVYDKHNIPFKTVDYVNNYAVRWSQDMKSLLFLKDGLNDINDSIQNSYLCALSMTRQRNIFTCFHTLDTDKIFNTVDYSYDSEKNEIYLSERTERNKEHLNIYSATSEKPESMRLLHTVEVDSSYNYRMGGVDRDNIYLLKMNEYKKGDLYAISKKDYSIDTLMYKRETPISGFSMIKDHVIIAYKNDKGNDASLINSKTKEKRNIGIKKEGRYSFLNNRNNSVIYVNYESYTTPAELFFTTPVKSKELKHVSSVRNLPFEENDFITEYKVIKDGSGDDLHFTISYCKGLKMNGKNPTILFTFLNAEDEAVNSFYFSRLLFMEQGYIYVQPSHVDFPSKIPYMQRIDDLKLITEYLIDNKYTSRNKLCLSGREYGSTAIAQLLNEDPSFCKAAILVDGIYDLVSRDISNTNIASLNVSTGHRNLFPLSPYHHIKKKASYPTMILLTTKNRNQIAPAHTYKYVAKLQMRTKSQNPVLMYEPAKIRMKSGLEFTNYYDNIYSTISFISKALNVDICESNFSLPGY